MIRALLVCVVLLTLWPSDSRATGAIRGTLWSSRGEARRAEVVRDRIRASQPRTKGLFDFLGTPSMRRTPAVPASAPSGGIGLKLPKPKPQPGVTDAVITVRRIPESAERRLADQLQRNRRHTNPRMVIQKSRFKPRVMTVAAGSELEFQNLDSIWHSTFSVSTAQRFDLGKLKPGAVDTVTLARAGVINLHCDIHPEETGFLVVAPNHAYARPDSLGRFELPRLPAGNYEVEIWHPVRGSRLRVVAVPLRGDAECDLAF